MDEEKRKKKFYRHKLKRSKSAQMLVEDEGVAHRINAFHAELWKFDPVDLDDVEAVRERTELFFQMCDEYNVKALYESYAYALGYSREWIRQVSNGIHKRASREILLKAYHRLISDMAQFTANGQINPVAGIFSQKNNFNYVDKVEVVATSVDPLGEQKSLPEIKQRLLESVPTEDVVDAEFTEVKEPIPLEQ